MDDVGDVDRAIGRYCHAEGESELPTAPGAEKAGGIGARAGAIAARAPFLLPRRGTGRVRTRADEGSKEPTQHPAARGSGAHRSDKQIEARGRRGFCHYGLP